MIAPHKGEISMLRMKSMREKKSMQTSLTDSDNNASSPDLDFWDGVDGLLKIQNLSSIYERHQPRNDVEKKEKSVIDLEVRLYIPRFALF